MQTSIITLTTDFGDADSYVAQMKGVMLCINPSVQFVDVTHAIPPQDVRRAADVLNEVASAFPPATIHLVVVDPGVGSERRLVAVEMWGQRFVGPDNGVFGRIAEHHPPHRVVVLDPGMIRREIGSDTSETSSTFHGRDLMAPVAAMWTLGRDLVHFGKPFEGRLVSLPDGLPRCESRTVVGEVRWVDAFGNLVTNIPHSLLPTGTAEKAIVEVGGRRIAGIRQFYGQQAAGDLLALVGSSGYLEIAVSQGNASETLGIGAGAEVRVTTGA